MVVATNAAVDIRILTNLFGNTKADCLDSSSPSAQAAHNMPPAFVCDKLGLSP